MISFTCTTCRHAMRIADQHAGKQAQCPKCTKRFVVPEPKAAAAATAGIVNLASASPEDELAAAAEAVAPSVRLRPRRKAANWPVRLAAGFVVLAVCAGAVVGLARLPHAQWDGAGSARSDVNAHNAVPGDEAEPVDHRRPRPEKTAAHTSTNTPADPTADHDAATVQVAAADRTEPDSAGDGDPTTSTTDPRVNAAAHADEDTTTKPLFSTTPGSLDAWSSVDTERDTEPRPIPVEPDYDPRTREDLERAWRANWVRASEGFYVSGDAVYHIPGFDPRKPSSSSLTRAALRGEYKLTWTESGRVTSASQTFHRPEEDIHVGYHVLPALRVGEYGYLYSVWVDRIAGDQVLASDIQIVPRNILADRDSTRERVERTLRRLSRSLGGRQVHDVTNFLYASRDHAAAVQSGVSPWARIRLIGFALPSGPSVEWRGPDQRGLHVVIVERDGTSFTAIPVDAVGRRVNEEQFINHIHSRGLSKLAFTEKMLERLRDGQDMTTIGRELLGSRQDGLRR